MFIFLHFVKKLEWLNLDLCFTLPESSPSLSKICYCLFWLALTMNKHLRQAILFQGMVSLNHLQLTSPKPRSSSLWLSQNPWVGGRWHKEKSESPT